MKKNKRRKRYWCVEYYDWELGYIFWGDYNSLKEAEKGLKILEERYPSHKWEDVSNSGLLIKSRLLKENQYVKPTT